MKTWVIDNKYCSWRIGPFHANDHYTCRHHKYYAKPCSYDGCPIKNTDASQCAVAADLLNLAENQKDMPPEFNKVVDKMLDDEIANG